MKFCFELLFSKVLFFRLKKDQNNKNRSDITLKQRVSKHA